MGRAILSIATDAVSEACAVTLPDTETDYTFFENRAALVLAGGGARAAYQVGVLRAIAEWLPHDEPCPFDVLVGTSAGALNASAIVARAARMRDAVEHLEAVWSGFLPRGQTARFQTETLTRMSPREQLDYDIAAINAGILTVDEIRAERGLAPNGTIAPLNV